MALLQDLNQQGTTIVLVTHDPRYADMAQRNIQLSDGMIVSDELVNADLVNMAHASKRQQVSIEVG
jgi:ABC-type lipoprotein export system ATPase subunit